MTKIYKNKREQTEGCKNIYRERAECDVSYRKLSPLFLSNAYSRGSSHYRRGSLNDPMGLGLASHPVQPCNHCTDIGIASLLPQEQNDSMRCLLREGEVSADYAPPEHRETKSQGGRRGRHFHHHYSGHLVLAYASAPGERGPRHHYPSQAEHRYQQFREVKSDRWDFDHHEVSDLPEPEQSRGVYLLLPKQRLGGGIHRYG
jgi:hypothetical protein